MPARSYFDDVWRRADLFGALHAYVSRQATAALDPAELLRAEWAMRVSALDLYVHELVSEKLLEIFRGTRQICAGYYKLQIGAAALMQIHTGGPGGASDAAFDLEVRSKLARWTFQYPDDIAEGIRMISSIELWNDIAKHHGATGQGIKSGASALRSDLTLIVTRRNKIVHEGDMQPSVPRVAWSVTRADVDHVRDVIMRVVDGIGSVI